MPHIYVLQHSDGNIQMCGEGADANGLKTLLQQAIDLIAQQQAQQNGQRPSGLIVPPTVVPRDAIQPPHPGGQP